MAREASLTRSPPPCRRPRSRRWSGLRNDLGIRPIPRTIKGFKRTLNGWTPPIPVPDPPRAVGEAQVRAQNVRVRIDGQTLLNGVDLTLHGGEIVALMGRNGSGKTTLLRTLFGFVKPECGRIEVAGLDMGARSPAELGARAGYLAAALRLGSFQ